MSAQQPSDSNLKLTRPHVLSHIPYSVVKEYLPDSASASQIAWLMARLTTDTDIKAAEISGVPAGTVSHWSNKKELDAAVSDITAVLALPLATAAIQGAVVKAVSVLSEALDAANWREKIAAANSILDRAGLIRGQDITSGGRALGMGEKVTEIVVRELVSGSDGSELLLSAGFDEEE